MYRVAQLRVALSWYFIFHHRDDDSVEDITNACHAIKFTNILYLPYDLYIIKSYNILFSIILR